MKHKYYNPWHKIGEPTHYENNAKCVCEYRDFRVYKVHDKHFDYVYDNCCITQRAGASDPKRVINTLLLSMTKKAS